MSEKKKVLRDSLDSIQKIARERTVKTQTIEYDLDTLFKRIDKKSIKLDPDYQRRHRWPVEVSSRLIESLILNIPIPVIFISQDVDVDSEVEGDVSRFTVIDGQQRLTAIYEFLKNDFSLEGLDTLSELNGSYYKQLPPFLVRRLEERTIRCMRVDSTLDPQVKFDIFERLNTGSVTLEPQELRNATARGPFNTLIKKLARYPAFRSMIQVPVDDEDAALNTKVKKMEDVELVLRFFALKDGNYIELKKGFKDFLTKSQERFNKLSSEELLESEQFFYKYMDFLYEFSGPIPFSKWKFENDEFKKVSNFNAAVFDAISIGILEFLKPDGIGRENEDVIRFLKNRRVVFKNKNFFSSVSGSVNDSSKVKFRIEYVRDSI